MFFGTGVTSSVIQAAGAPGGGVSARPKALVVLVKTKAPTPARGRFFQQVQRAGDVGVDEVLAAVRGHVRLVQRGGVEHGIDAAHAAGDERAIGDRADMRRVKGDASMSMPDRVVRRVAAALRISASPRWPALPVTRIFTVDLS